MDTMLESSVSPLLALFLVGAAFAIPSYMLAIEQSA
jgi:hypothetical protein